jgi:hypothetical protein
VAAQVRVLRGDGLPDDQARYLPGAAWNRWIARRGAELVAGDQGALALDLIGARLSRQAVAEEPAWLAQAYSDTAHWDDYWELVPRLDQGTSRALQEERRSGRYAMLNALSSRNPHNMAQYDSYLAGFLNDPAVVAPSGPALERLFLALLCTLGVPASPRYEPFGSAAVPAGRLSPLPVLTDEHGEIGPYPVDQIRRALVWAGTPESGDTFLLRRLAGLFCPNPVWIAAFSQLIDDDFSRIENYVQTLIDAAGRAHWVAWAATHLGVSGLPLRGPDGPATGTLRSHDVLGEWAARFARPWKDQIQLRRDRLRDHPELISVLRGDNPEMRPAIRLALAEAASEHGGLRRLAGIAHQTLPIPVVDLEPDAVPPVTSSEARKVLVQLVEYVDRSGVMGEFLAAVRAEWPNSELLDRVGDAFRVWDESHALMLTGVISANFM